MFAVLVQEEQIQVQKALARPHVHSIVPLVRSKHIRQFLETHKALPTELRLRHFLETANRARVLLRVAVDQILHAVSSSGVEEEEDGDHAKKKKNNPFARHFLLRTSCASQTNFPLALPSMPDKFRRWH